MTLTEFFKFNTLWYFFLHLTWIGFAKPKHKELGESMETKAPTGGSCVGEDTNIWFPVMEKWVGREKRKLLNDSINKAVAICQDCKVKEQCLDYSLENEPWGIWGGLNELQRAELRKIRGVALSRDGKIYIPGVGSRSANGHSLPSTSRLPEGFTSK
jgi:WhiB family redox-sensing transcriptional regulator